MFILGLSYQYIGYIHHEIQRDTFISFMFVPILTRTMGLARFIISIILTFFITKKKI